MHYLEFRATLKYCLFLIFYTKDSSFRCQKNKKVKRHFINSNNEKEIIRKKYKCLDTCNGPLSSNCLTCDTIYRQLDFSTCICQANYYDIENYNVQTFTILDKNVLIILKMGALFVLLNFILEYKKVTHVNVLMDIMKNQIYHSVKVIIQIINQKNVLISLVCSSFCGAISTFDFNGLVKCQRCHYSCGTCGGIEETDWLTCMESDNRYQVGNTCICKDGYFISGLPICQKCSQILVPHAKIILQNISFWFQQMHAFIDIMMMDKMLNWIY
ncbi:unnamed protein product [Paramecium sonneborni]|uniref:Uncharacterized protein n=1 Tax=Paramecium sonneborni TaxID=65129 RepID=A0A8S1RSJ2_9CILI|nr:unnamed protein product [Paramecium sonneborni]